jgi:hypothetical protein
MPFPFAFAWLNAIQAVRHSHTTGALLRITIGQGGKKAILLLAFNVSPTTIVASLAFLVLYFDLEMTKRSLSWIQLSKRFVEGGSVAFCGIIMMSVAFCGIIMTRIVEFVLIEVCIPHL